MDCSFYSTLLSFVQIAVALNFGLIFFDKSSNIAHIKDWVNSFITQLTSKMVRKSANQMKRYRKRTATTEQTKMHENVKRYRGMIVSPWDAIEELSYMPGLAVTAGIYSLAFLVVVAFLADNNEVASYLMFALFCTTWFMYAILLFFEFCVKIATTVMSYMFAYSIFLFVFCYFSFSNYSLFAWIPYTDSYIVMTLIAPYFPVIILVSKVVIILIKKENLFFRLSYWTVRLDMYYKSHAVSTSVET